MPDLPVPSSDDRQVIVCLYCEKPQEISKRALSVTCKFCNKSLRLEDIDPEHHGKDHVGRRWWRGRRFDDGERCGNNRLTSAATDQTKQHREDGQDGG